MGQGRTLRRIGALGMVVGGLLGALVVTTQFVLLSGARDSASFTDSMAVINGVAGALGYVGFLFLLAAFVLLAFSRGRLGVFGSSLLPRVGFIVLAVIYALAQVFFFAAPLFYYATNSALILPINGIVNLIVVVAILFAAITVLVKGAFRGFARFSLFLPAAMLIAAQFPLVASYPGYLLPQAVFGLMWVVVGISYFAAKPREAAVTAASENLAE